MNNKKIWGGVFGEKGGKKSNTIIMPPIFKVIEEKMLPFYLQETIAHNQMLKEQKIISAPLADQIIEGLKKIQSLYQKGEFHIDPQIGDVHENVEAFLTQINPQAGKNFHLARSRNDQSLTDQRMFLRFIVKKIIVQLETLIKTVAIKAEEYPDLPMPGYTHMQPAQATTFSYWLNSYNTAWQRDLTRLKETYKRLNSLPLGACAGFGTKLPINRSRVAELLKFDKVDENTIDTLSNRGEMTIEILQNLSFLTLHLGRLASELILFSTFEYQFIQVGEEFCTGSSIMPQKKNQDVLELIRALPSRIWGETISNLTLFKNLPAGYQRDSRETKRGLLIIEDVADALSLFSDLLGTLTPQPGKMKNTLEKSYLYSLDLAHDLMKKYQLTFRDAHHITGQLVKKLSAKKRLWKELTKEEIENMVQKFS